jgi:hypothetical protein
VPGARIIIPIGMLLKTAGVPIKRRSQGKALASG